MASPTPPPLPDPPPGSDPTGNPKGPQPQKPQPAIEASNYFAFGSNIPHPSDL